MCRGFNSERECRNVCDRNVAEELQSEMQVLFADPACANFGKLAAKLLAVFDNARAQIAR